MKITMMKRILALLLLVPALSIAGCSWFSSDEEKRPKDFGHEGTEPDAENRGQDPKMGEPPLGPEDGSVATQMPGILVQWQVPSEEVDYYHVYFGTDKDNLKKHATVPPINDLIPNSVSVSRCPGAKALMPPI